MEEFSTNTELGTPITKLGNSKKNVFYLLGGIVFLIVFYILFFSAPRNFQPGIIIQIDEGMNLHGVSALLKKENIIRSRLVFESFVIILGGEKHTISAGYLFENKLPVWQVAGRIVRGEHHMPPVSVTIPEGFDIAQIADTFASKLTGFNKNKFLLEAKSKEGYLFPDTYFFFNNANEINVIKSMQDNFEKKITPLLSRINASGKKENDIIVMASIVEREAKGEVDRGVIAGILWKRISIGMPLQVDVASETYKTKGLSKNPIGNPGLGAIVASINPQSSPYLYYLHDKNGVVHYAKNLTEHNINIKKYLK